MVKSLAFVLRMPYLSSRSPGTAVRGLFGKSSRGLTQPKSDIRTNCGFERGRLDPRPHLQTRRAWGQV
jgi:hypothetical protein